MQQNSSDYISSLENTRTPTSGWAKNLLRITLVFVAASSTFAGVMLLVKSKTSNVLSLQSSDVVIARVDLSRPGLAIRRSFLGFSFEYGDILNFTGKTSTTINPVFIQLLNNLGLNNGAPLVRVGGSSTDESWWNPNGSAKPPGIRYNITATDLSSLEASLSQTGSRVILGLNLGQNQTGRAVEFVKAALFRLPADRILSFEIGNEPDIYMYHRYYKNPTNGAEVHVRSSSYTFSEYLSEFTNYSTTLKDSFSKMPPLAGPVFTTNKNGWMQYLPTFLSNQASMVNLITYHRYPLSACSFSKPGSSTDPTTTNLLSDQASLRQAQAMIPFVNQAKQYRRGLWLTEFNSVSCGGTDGVSNTLAAALWGTDVLFNMAKVGVRGVNFHGGSDAYYSPFSFRSSKNSSGDYVYKATVKPLYYGMLLFAKAAANKSQLLPVSVQTASNVKVWATMDSHKVIKVVAINKDPRASGNAKIQLSSTRSNGSLIRLTAPAASTTTGITLGGQTFDGTTDGKPLGTYVSTIVTPKNRIYSFPLPASSAALLTINP